MGKLIIETLMVIISLMTIVVAFIVLTGFMTIIGFEYNNTNNKTQKEYVKENVGEEEFSEYKQVYEVDKDDVREKQLMRDMLETLDRIAEKEDDKGDKDEKEEPVEVEKSEKPQITSKILSIRTIDNNNDMGKIQTIQPSRMGNTEETFTVTAYDLSYESCEKHMDHPQYGVTASGRSIKGMTREEAMTVAVDPSVIPMGSKIRLEFIDSRYSKYNGIYTAKDKGGAIKGNKIDLFMGDFNKEESDKSVWEFGKTQAKVYIQK